LREGASSGERASLKSPLTLMMLFGLGKIMLFLVLMKICSSNVLEQVNQFNASGNFAAIITGDDGNGYLTMKNGTNAVLIGGVKTNGVYNGIGADMSQDVNGTTVYTVSGTNALGGKVNLSLTNVLSSSAPLYKMLVPLVQTNTSSPAASVPVAKTPAATGANATYTPRP